MRIQKGKYVLYSDQWNWWITEIRTYEKGKHQGETYEERIAGYCLSLDKLADDFTERVLRSNDAEDLEAVLTALKDAQEACKELLTEAVQTEPKGGADADVTRTD